MNSDCLVAASKESGQVAGTLTWANGCAMWKRLLPSSRANSVWLINQDVLPELFTMSQTIGTGGATVYLPADGAAGRPHQTLLGQPVIPCEQCQTLGTAGNVILADLSQIVAIDKGAAQHDISIQVRFVYSESCFRVVYRFDCQPVLLL